MPLLLGALGSLAAPVLGSLFGKGLQVDAQQKPYSRVPRGKGLQVDAQQRLYRRIKKKKKKKKKKKNEKENKINFRNKPISNFDIMNCV